MGKIMEFRHLVAPRTRRERARRRDAIIAAQKMSDDDLAVSVSVAAQRVLHHQANTTSQNDTLTWACKNLIPRIATRLSGQTPVGEDPAHLQQALIEILSQLQMHPTRGTSTMPGFDLEFLFGITFQASALSLAMDRILPGSFPRRQTIDARPPLDGRYVILSTQGQDRVLFYSDAHDQADEVFDEIVSMVDAPPGLRRPTRHPRLQRNISLAWDVVEHEQGWRIMVQDYSGSPLRIIWKIDRIQQSG